MTSNTRSNNVRLTALEADVAEIKTGLKALLSRFEAPAPEAEAESVVDRKALKAALRAHKAAGVIPSGVSVKAAIELGLMTETGDLPGKGRKARTAEPKAEPEGLTFPELRQALRAHKAAGLAPKGLTVREAIAGGVMDAFGNLVGVAAGVAAGVALGAKVEAEAPAKERKARKVTEREPEPEYGTPAWIAWARPSDDGAPRRANGTATPKAEWPMRMALESTGRYDRDEIDRMVAAAMGANA